MKPDIEGLFLKEYLEPSDLWLEKQEQLIGTMITAATFQTLKRKKVYTVEENLDENVKHHMYENGLLIKEYVVDQKVHYEVVSKVEYKVESVQADKTTGSKVLDIIQTGLDIVGLVPAFGEPVDIINGTIYAARGDAVNAALSYGAAIPFAGWAGTFAKLTGKAKDLNQVSKVVSTEKMESIYSPIYQDVVNGSLGKTQNQLDLLSNTPYQLGTPNAFTVNTPFAKTDIPTSIKSGDVDVKVEVKNVDAGAKGTGEGTEHIGKLKGKEVLLKDIIEKEVTYTKRDREEFKKLRNKFNNSERRNFIEYLVNDEKKLKQLIDAGLTETDIKNLKNGLVPDGYQVHHKLPLDDGGTNSFENLILIKNDPYHKVLTNSQKDLTKGMKVGESIDIKWPLPEGFIYPSIKK